MTTEIYYQLQWLVPKENSIRKEAFWHRYQDCRYLTDIDELKEKYKLAVLKDGIENVRVLKINEEVVDIKDLR